MGKPSTFLIELHYLPCLEFFTGMLKHDILCLEKSENFQKQSYRNRCFIRGANKIQLLTIPVRKPANRYPVKQVEIDYSQNWLAGHWQSIQSAYGKAPFFEYYADSFRQLLDSRPQFLFDLNHRLLTLCLQVLQIPVSVLFTDHYQDDVTNPVIKDARNTILSSNRGKSALYYHPMPYTQVFGQNFEPNLSILDIIFCLGPQARDTLAQSVKDTKQT